jgi:Uncharacterized conserved protein
MVEQIEINREPVELYKVLKFHGLVGSGGEAKQLIDAGQVQVNGQVEQRKRCKLVAGDLIDFQSHQYQLVFSEPEQE